MFNQQQQEMEALNLDFNNELEFNKIYTKSVEINSLFDLVGQNKPKQDEQEIEKTTKNSHLDFVRVPPLNKLVAPKPIFLDVAYDYIGNHYTIICVRINDSDFNVLNIV